jgi:hypothetical protein
MFQQVSEGRFTRPGYVLCSWRCLLSSTLYCHTLEVDLNIGVQYVYRLRFTVSFYVIGNSLPQKLGWKTGLSDDTKDKLPLPGQSHRVCILYDNFHPLMSRWEGSHMGQSLMRLLNLNCGDHYYNKRLEYPQRSYIGIYLRFARS